MNKTKLVK